MLVQDRMELHGGREINVSQWVEQGGWGAMLEGLVGGGLPPTGPQALY